MNILYILKLKDEPLIKIGISTKGSFGWLYELVKRYKVSLKDSYLISADERQTVNRLESIIIKKYGHYKPSKRLLKKYDTKDGHREILRWDCLEDILKLIRVEMQDEKLGIGIVTMDKIIY
jgi:hypothetical protein